MVMAGFGCRVRQALDLSGTSIPELAKRCGMDRSTAEKWTHDDREVATVTAKNLYAAADYMKVDPRWLATGEGEARPPSHGLSFTAKRLADDIENLPAEAQLAISALLNSLKRK